MFFIFIGIISYFTWQPEMGSKYNFSSIYGLQNTYLQPLEGDYNKLSEIKGITCSKGWVRKNIEALC